MKKISSDCTEYAGATAISNSNPSDRMKRNNEDSQPTPDEIIARMQSVRSRLGDDASSVRTSVKELTDWKLAVRRFPWAAAGLAAAVGFLVVPKRSVEHTVDPETLRKMANEHRVVVTPPSHETQQKGMGNAIVAMVAPALARAAIGYLGQRMTQSTSAAKHRTD